MSIFTLPLAKSIFTQTMI